LSASSRGKKWRPVDANEIKTFLGMIIVTGLCPKSDIQDYWAGDETIDTPYFRNRMSRDRFLIILSNFHMSDNENQVPRGHDGFDPLYKVRPFINLVTNRSVMFIRLTETLASMNPLVLGKEDFDLGFIAQQNQLVLE
jgi:hypothetical protein